MIILLHTFLCSKDELKTLLEKEKEQKLKKGTLVVARAAFVAESSDVGALAVHKNCNNMHLGFTV